MEKAKFPTAAQALQLYLQQPNAERELIEFFKSWRKVSPKTVERWMSGEQFPAGENLNVLAYFLARKGFDSAEYEVIPERYITCLAAIVFNVTTPIEVARRLGLPAVSNLWRAFRGRGLLPQREKLMEELSKAFLPPVLERESIWFGGSTTLLADPVAATIAYGSQDLILSVLAHQMRAMLPLVSVVNGSQFSDAQRERLRQEVGATVVFDLSNGLSDLCSKKSRDMGQRGGAGGE